MGLAGSGGAVGILEHATGGRSHEITPFGNGIGARSIGTGVIVICRTGLPSTPVIFVPLGIVRISPGASGVDACTVWVVKPLASSGRLMGCAVSRIGK